MAKPPVSDVIVTKRLPQICPACGYSAISAQDRQGIHLVGCARCGWAAKYELKETA